MSNFIAFNMPIITTKINYDMYQEDVFFNCHKFHKVVQTNW